MFFLIIVIQEHVSVGARYYEEKRRAFPQLCERVKGVDYSKGAEIFNQATPIVE